MSVPIPILLMAQELNLGGSERQMAEIAKALDRSQFDPRVGCFRPAGLRADDLRAAGVPIVHFPVPTMVSLRGALRIGAYVREQGIRLVHTFDTPANSYGVPAARLIGGTAVVSSQRVDRALWPAAQRHAMRITDHMVDAIVVNCEFLRRSLRDEEKVPDGMIRLCYNGVDTNLFRPASSPRPDVLRDASLVIGVVCALRPEKGLEVLLEAFAAAGHLPPGAKLAVVGSGPSLSKLQDRARELGVMSACVFEPATSRVADWLHAIDIFVLPSFSEALSNSLMEAMACGCCVVASRVGGNPELVAHGETGMLFEAGDAVGLASILCALASDPQRRAGLASMASALMNSRFSLATAARRMGEIYSDVLAGSTTARAANLRD